jgi:hypothetical protein
MSKKGLSKNSAINTICYSISGLMYVILDLMRRVKVFKTKNDLVAIIL